jgi:hypothetical protein
MVEILELTQVFSCAKEILVYRNGKCAIYEKESLPYCRIQATWSSLLNKAQLMPAFGVSLPKEVEEAKKQGVWVEFNFPQTYVCNGMPFEKLLVDVQPYFTGFNLHRFTSERGYNGRCFYMNIPTNLSLLYYQLLGMV